MNLIFASLGRIFQNQYGFSTSASGLMYLGVTTGFLIGAFFFGWTSDRISRWLMLRNDGQREAEFRLPALMAGLPLVVTGLVWYGWSAQNHVFWLVVVLGLNVFGMGVTTVQVGFSHQEIVRYCYTDGALALLTDLSGGLFHGVLGLCTCCNHCDKMHRRIADPASWPCPIPDARSRLGKQCAGIVQPCTLRGAVHSVRLGEIVAREVFAKEHVGR